MRQNMDPGHGEIRSVLKVIGPIVALTGLVFVVVGVGSFFAAFGSHESPRHFWCAFVGMPLLAVGIGISKFAFMGQIARYVANEVAPVGKDAFNYMASGTKDAVRDLAAAVGEGLRSGGPGEVVPLIRCHKCNTDNDAGANFCDRCGAPLRTSQQCPDCGELNDPDARFCNNCGKEIG